MQAPQAAVLFAIWRELFDAHDLGMQDVRRHALALLDRGLELTP